MSIPYQYHPRIKLLYIYLNNIRQPTQPFQQVTYANVVKKNPVNRPPPPPGTPPPRKRSPRVTSPSPQPIVTKNRFEALAKGNGPAPTMIGAMMETVWMNHQLHRTCPSPPRGPAPKYRRPQQLTIMSFLSKEQKARLTM